jgi:hypothetical protein
MAVSNSLGSNIFDICIGLGIPWLVKDIVDYPKTITIYSDSLTITVFILFITVAIVVWVIHYKKWQLSRGMGVFFLFVYVLFALQAVLTVRGATSLSSSRCFFCCLFVRLARVSCFCDCLFACATHTLTVLFLDPTLRRSTRSFSPRTARQAWPCPRHRQRRRVVDANRAARGQCRSVYVCLDQDHHWSMLIEKWLHGRVAGYNI